MNKASQQRVRKQFTSARSPQSLRPTATALAIAACFSGNLALANPANPTVVNGIASFAQAGNILNITNSPNAIINWGSFSIGVNELTRFLQQSASSAVMNRVIGQDPSAILGALQSNGRVFLLNPNGIVFGAGSQVDVAGLVASTLNLSDQDFLNNRLNFTDGAGAGSVVNQGSITGGSVYLVGNAVTNDGLITSPQGEVILAAGNSVELVSPGTPNLRVEIVAPDNEARNLGTITADAGRIGIYAGLINNSGTLNASSAVAEGGRIMLQATKNTTLAASSILDASGVGGGRIDVLAEDTVYVDGRLDASAPTGGDGGFIETSGKNRVKIESSALITTNAPQGKTGMWLIDPDGFSIQSDGSGDAYGSDIEFSLSSTSVTITSTTGFGAFPSSGTSGNIIVNDSIAWNNANSLTLLATNDVIIGSSGYIDGGGDVNFYAGWNGGSTTTPVVNNGIGDIASANCCNTIQTHGNILFEAGRNIVLDGMTVLAGSNSIGLANDSAAKSVQLIAGNNIDLVLPSDNPSEIFAFGNSGSAASVVLNAKAGSITIRSGNEIQARGGGGVEGSGGDATVTLCTGALSAGVCTPSATGGITIADSAVGAMGGDGSSGRGGDAEVKLTSGSGGIQVSGNGFVSGASSTNRAIYAVGGNGSSGDGGNATVQLKSAGAIAVNAAGSVVASGGTGSGFYGGNIGGSAAVVLDAATNITVAYGGSIEAIGRGGSGGEGSIGFPFPVSAVVALTSGGDITVAGSIAAVGGNSGSGGSGANSAVVFLDSGNNINVSGSVTATAGSNFGCCGSNGAGILVTAAGNVINTGTIAAYGEGGEGNDGFGVVQIDAGGNITQNGLIAADGGEGAVIALGAAGAILQTNNGGSLRATSNGFFFSTPEVHLTAQTGIGTLAAPIRIDNSDDPDIYALNGATGDIAVSLFDGRVTLDGGSDTMVGVYNANPNGTYFIQSETDGIQVNGAFRPGEFVAADLGINQKVVLKALSGMDITIDGAEGGSIVVPAGGNGGVTLEADIINIWDGGSVVIGAQNVLLKADNMEIQGSIDAGTAKLQALSGGAMEIGGLVESGNTAVKLTQTELDWIATPQLIIGDDIAGGALTVVGNLAYATGLLELRGSNISQSGGNLTGLFNATAAGTINLSQSGDLTLGLLKAGTSVSVNSSGGALLDGNTGLNIEAPTASLSSSTGVGSLANPLETKVSTLSVSAYGGEIGVINTGNLTLNSLNFGGTFASIGATGSMDLGGPASVTNLALLANNGLTVGQNINASGGLSLGSGAGNLLINNGANVFAATTIGLAGVNVSLDSAYVSASGSLVVAATGNLDVMNVSSLSGGGNGIGNATIGVGGNVTVDNSTILGTPDVVMNVGGVINMNNGGTIQAAAPTTIMLTFPMLASGGFFVNGIDGVVYDPLTFTGFLANGSPAILGTNLLVTYGGGSLQPPTDALLVAMGESITPPEPEKDKDIFEDVKDDKKDAPVCR